MWKKDEVTQQNPARPGSEIKPPSQPPTTPPPAQGERAVIGKSISIVGEVKGKEDLLIQGQIEGTVDLREQSVTIGSEGEVKANITGRVVAVDGQVEGNLHAEEQVILRSSARVQGDITAPRVVLEDGARFRGLVDMGETEKSAGDGSTLQSTATADSPRSGATDSGRNSSGNSKGSEKKTAGGAKGKSEVAEVAAS